MTDSTRAKLELVASAYGRLQHSPNDSVVSFAYERFKAEIWIQYLTLVGLLVAVPRISFSNLDPYPNSDTMLAACDDGHLRVYRTADDLPTDHPLAQLAPNGETYNSIFRAVHDILGHWTERNSFGPSGELAAFRAHARTLSPLALHAMATETLGHNAWFNFGPYAHLKPSERPYAEQKACLLPFSYIMELL